MAQILYLVFIFLAAVTTNGEIPSQDQNAPYIVGGEDTTIEEHPHQVSVEYEGHHQCGGSVVNETIILTAAHCLKYIQSIRAGSTIREEGGQVINVRQKIPHPDFNRRTRDYDAAILILESPLTLDEKVQPVKLADENEELPVGTDCTLTGWGALTEGGGLSSILQKVTVPSVSQEKCQELYSSKGKEITPRMLCAGFVEEGGKDSCNGDSGGPLIALGKLHGIISFGAGCARPQFPGVNTRVTSIRDWIRSVTGL